MKNLLRKYNKTLLIDVGTAAHKVTGTVHRQLGIQTPLCLATLFLMQFLLIRRVLFLLLLLLLRLHLPPRLHLLLRPC